MLHPGPQVRPPRQLPQDEEASLHLLGVCRAEGGIQPVEQLELLLTTELLRTLDGIDEVAEVGQRRLRARREGRREAGRAAVVCLGDLTEEEQCAAVVDRAVADLGGIDILVDNAAYQMAQPGDIADVTTEQFDRVMKTNLYAMFWLCKKALPHLKAGATIVNTSSIQSRQPSPELLDYATTKAGIVAFTQGLAGQLAERGIRVNSVAPGPIWTPLIPATMGEDQVEGFGEQTPLGRADQPAEVASAFVFLASPESSYVTGEALGVTGGQPLT